MRDIGTAAKHGGQRIGLAMLNMALRPHLPYDVAGDGTGPAWCLRCNRAWPCGDFLKLSDQRDALREEMART